MKEHTFHMNKIIALNEDKSIEVREVQLPNIRVISLTLLVLNEDKSIEVREQHSKNILFISLTLLVLNEDKSIDFKL